MSMSREELQDSVRRAFQSDNFGLDHEESWNQLVEMGYLMMGVPEELGGLGFGQRELGTIYYELGRALVPGPAVTQFSVIEALCASPQSDRRDDLLGKVMEGQIVAASLIDPASGKGPILAADKAEHLLLASPGEVVLHPTTDVEAAPRQGWDETRRLFDAAVSGGAKGEVIAEGDAARAVYDAILASQLLAVAGDSLGGADAVLAMTIDYLGTRRQFDRPLALFQALKHRVADLRTALTTAEALYWSRAGGEASLTELGALKAHAAMVYKTVAEEAIQLHGGIGLTQEYPCHLFLKRAFLNAAVCGDADYWEERAGREMFAARA